MTHQTLSLGKCWKLFPATLRNWEGDAVVSWLVRSSPVQVVWVRALAGDTALCSWARHVTPTDSASLHPAYKWVPANSMLFQRLIYFQETMI